KLFSATALNPALSVRGDLTQIPVARRLRLLARLCAQQVAGRKLVCVLVDRERSRNACGSQIGADGSRVDPRIECRMFPQRAQFGAEQESAAGQSCPVQRLDADPVAYQPKAPLAAIPECQREHAVAALDGVYDSP